MVGTRAEVEIRHHVACKLILTGQFTCAMPPSRGGPTKGPGWHRPHQKNRFSFYSVVGRISKNKSNIRAVN